MSVQPSRRGVLSLLTMLLMPLPASALTVHTLDIIHSHGGYRVNFDVVLDAAPAHVYAMLADYRQWPHLDDTITESRLLQTFANGKQRVRLIFHSCLLVFCRNVNQTKDLEKRLDGTISTAMIPGQSDFRQGWERWQIEAVADKTRMRYDAEFSLAFAIVPVVFKTRLRHKLLVMAQRLEAPRATNANPAPSTK